MISAKWCLLRSPRSLFSAKEKFIAAEKRREKGCEREGMDSARLNCNWSHQVQLGVEVIYRINKKRALTAGAD